MYKTRRLALPKSPSTVTEIEEAFKIDFIRRYYGMTRRHNVEHKSDFFKHAFECDDFAFCVFASDDIIKAIEENEPIETRKLYADGTFKITPIGIFSQVLIVFCELHETVRFLSFLFESFFKFNFKHFINFNYFLFSQLIHLFQVLFLSRLVFL